MEKAKKEILRKLRDIKQTATVDLETNNFENYEVKDVIHYNEMVKLTNKKTGKKEEFTLYVVITENFKATKDKEAIFEIEYVENKNGETFTIADLIHEYDGFENIKDVVDKSKENEKLSENKKDKKLAKESLMELEKEEIKEKEENEKEAIKTSNITGAKPKNVMQTVNIDKAYVEEWKTVRRAFKIPQGVESIAVSEPMKGDTNALADDLTIYMLDKNGNIIENVEGNNIKDFFKVDETMRKNAMNDASTQLGLNEESAKRADGQIVRNFRSIQNPDLYLATNQKRVGEYIEVSAGRKTKDGNDFVGVQLETRNVEVQTDLEKQKIVSGHRGIYNADNIDKEVDEHVNHGDDEKKIAIENADGQENTIEICDSPYIPGTEMTWEELSEETGEGITKLQERFERELEDGKEPKEIVEEIEYDYGMIEHEHNKDLS